MPLHARSVAIAQAILGRGCAQIKIAPTETAPEDDDREFFVAAWCLHPRFVPEEKIIFIPEPDARVPGNALWLNEGEAILNGLPGLCYLVRLRVVEYQDWSTPPPSSDDEGYGGSGNRDDDDSNDSNFNRRHPHLDDGGDYHARGPRSFRLASADEDVPRLGGRQGTTFMPRRSVIIGSVACPLGNNGRVTVGPRIVVTPGAPLPPLPCATHAVGARHQDGSAATTASASTPDPNFCDDAALLGGGPT